jgi:hypothetical protein
VRPLKNSTCRGAEEVIEEYWKELNRKKDSRRSSIMKSSQPASSPTQPQAFQPVGSQPKPSSSVSPKKRTRSESSEEVAKELGPRETSKQAQISRGNKAVTLAETVDQAVILVNEDSDIDEVEDDDRYPLSANITKHRQDRSWEVRLIIRFGALATHNSEFGAETHHRGPVDRTRRGYPHVLSRVVNTFCRSRPEPCSSPFVDRVDGDQGWAPASMVDQKCPQKVTFSMVEFAAII